MISVLRIADGLRRCRLLRNQAALLILFDFSAADDVFNALRDAGLLRAGESRVMIFRLDLGRADYVRRDGDDDVALIVRLSGRCKQTSENRNHADPWDRDAAVAFVVLLDRSRHRRDAVLHA